MSAGDRFFRFSLPALFGVVLFFAFGVAAIRYASPLWAGLTMAVTLPVLFVAILGALFRLGQARAFWTGVAVCGWGYLLLVLVPWFETGVGQHLPTHYLLGYVHTQLQKQLPVTPSPHEAVPGMVGPGGGSGMAGLGGGSGMAGAGGGSGMGPGMASGPMGGVGRRMKRVGPHLSLVLRIGHALFALLFGFFGGIMAKWFYLTRPPQFQQGNQGRRE